MRKKAVFLSLLLCSLSAASPAPAEESLRGESRTYLRSWESLDSERHFPFYEYLDADVPISSVGGLSFHLGGWGRVDLGAESYGDRTNGELQYGYLDWALGKSDATVRLGRLAVSEGVALYETLDGVYVRGGLAGGFSLALYGGVPLETDEDGRGSDLLYGGRVGFARPGLAGIGASYLRQDNDGDEWREEFGVDLFLQLGTWLRVDGQSAYSGIQSAWMDHDYRLLLGPWRNLTLIADLWQVDYDSYFQSPGSGAFRPPALGAGESSTVLGGEIEYAFSPAVVVAATYQSYSYDFMGNADSYGARLSWQGRRARAGLVYDRVDGSTDSLRYSLYRGYVFKEFGGLDLTLDAHDVVYDEEINGVKDAYALVAALGYDFSGRLRLAGDVEYGSNPFFEEEVKALVKLLWRFPASADGSGEEKK